MYSIYVSHISSEGGGWEEIRRKIKYEQIIK